MAVGINIEFKDPCKEGPYIPFAPQGTYRALWVPIARRLGLVWMPEFLTGIPVPIESLPEVIDEIRQVREDLIRNGPPKVYSMKVDVERLIERADFILEKLTELDPNEIAEIYIG